MKRFFSLIFALSLIATCLHSQSVSTIPITVDPRVELVSTVFHLAGHDEYNMNMFPAYVKKLDEYFREFKDHDAVKYAKKIKGLNGISYNAPMGLATYLKDVESFETKIPFDPIPEDLDERWNTKIATKFIGYLKEFWIDTDFQTFLDQNKEMYDIAVERFSALVEKHDLTNWFDEYFGVPPGNQFHIILGLINGGANYASRATLTDGQKEIFSVMGCWMQDDEGLPVFPENIISVVVHEFCHSYTNPIVEKYESELEKSASKLFDPVRKKMKAMAYPNWKTMMKESFVRATVVRFMKQNFGLEAYTKQKEFENRRGFYWVDDMAEVYEQYENNMDLYANFEEFVPVFIEYLNDNIAELVNETMEKEKGIDWDLMKSTGPKITDINPKNGDQNVDPNIRELRVTFDRAMNGNYSVLKKYFEKYPKINGDPRWENGNTIFILPIKLEPEWEYYMELNSTSQYFFQDKNGNPLYPYVLKFKTRK